MNRPETSLEEHRSEGQGVQCPTTAAGQVDCGKQGKAFIQSTDEDTELQEGGEEGSEQEAAGRAHSVGPDNPEHTGTSPWRTRSFLSASLHLLMGGAGGWDQIPRPRSGIHGPYLTEDGESFKRAPEELILSRYFYP